MPLSFLKIFRLLAARGLRLLTARERRLLAEWLRLNAAGLRPHAAAPPAGGLQPLLAAGLPLLFEAALRLLAAGLRLLLLVAGLRLLRLAYRDDYYCS